MFEPRMLSKMIRMKKKKAMNAEPDLVHSDAKVDMNPMDLYNVDQQAQMKETVGSPEQSDARDKQYNNEAQQEAMSKEPMASKNMPKDHGRLAYGGVVQPGSEREAMDMGPEMERKYVAGSPESNQEMARRFSNKPSIGVGEGNGPMLGDGEMSEEERRIKMRKMRLDSYLNGLDYNE